MMVAKYGDAREWWSPVTVMTGVCSNDDGGDDDDDDMRVSSRHRRWA